MPANGEVLVCGGATRGDATRSRLGMADQIRVVEFLLRDHDVGVGVRGDGEVPLADVLTDPGPGNADCRLVFGDAAHLATSELTDGLSEIPDSPWGDYYGKQISGRRVADLLRPYGIRAKHKRDGSTYFRADFEDSWARYAPQSVTSVTDRMVEPKTAIPKCHTNSWVTVLKMA